jgi:hypothetical protein
MSRREPWHIVAIGLILGLVTMGGWFALTSSRRAEPRAADSVAFSRDRTAAASDSNLESAPSEVAIEPVAGVASSPAGIRGRVIDAATQGPVLAFKLEIEAMTARDTAQPEARSFRTNDGHFEWPQIPSGKWAVTASALGYLPLQLRGLDVPSVGPAAEIVLALRRGYELRGRIYDALSGVGISSADIGFRESHTGRFEGDWQARPQTRSKADGSFLLDGIPSGNITLSVRAKDYAEREVNVVIQENPASLEIALTTGARIAGNFMSADRRSGVTGSVALISVDQGFSVASTSTDASGQFSFEHLAPGHYRLIGESGGRSVEQTVTLSSSQQAVGVILALPTGHNIHGTVKGLTRDELRLVRVSVRRQDQAGPTLTSVPVGPQGEYTMVGVEPGPLRVVANINLRRQISRAIDMPEDSDISVDLIFPPGVRLSGTVTRGGMPLGGARLVPRPVSQGNISFHGSSTAADGSYLIDGLPEGEYYLFVGTYQTKLIQLAGDTVFNVEVPVAELSGRLFEDGSETPIAGADVDIWLAEPNSRPLRLHNRTNQLGQFVFAGLDAGDFVLTAHKPGYEMYRQRISFAPPSAGMVIGLRTALGIEIIVREASTGKPLQSVVASEMIGNDVGSKIRVPLDEGGVGSLPSALTGSTLSFSAAGYAPTVIADWNGQRLNLQLSRQQSR